MVGVEIDLETAAALGGRFLLFRGRAELLGGIVSVTITDRSQGQLSTASAPTVPVPI